MSRVFTLLLVCVVLSSCGRGTAAAVDGAEIYWESSGNGPTIVLVHGRGRDNTDWRYQVDEFKGDYRVVALDMPNDGKSGDLPDAQDGSSRITSLVPHAEAIEAVRAEQGIDQMVLVGHSSGGWAIGEYMMRYPQYVAGVVAVDTSFISPPDAGFERTMTPEDSFEVPALYVLAVDGSILQRDIQPAALLQTTPRGRVEVMPEGVGHNIQYEDPIGFNRLLREFVEEIDFWGCRN